MQELTEIFSANAFFVKLYHLKLAMAAQ